MVSGVTGGTSLRVGVISVVGSTPLESGLALGEKGGESLAGIRGVPACLLGLDLPRESLLESIPERSADGALDFGDRDRGTAREALGESERLAHEHIGRKHPAHDPQAVRLR